MPETCACAHCGSVVTPTPEGYCPACVQPFREAAKGQTTFEGENIDMQRDTSHHALVKLALIFFVVPVVSQLASLGIGLLVTLPLAALSPETQPAIMPSLGIGGSILGLAFGILAAWKFWPRS